MIDMKPVRIKTVGNTSLFLKRVKGSISNDIANPTSPNTLCLLVEGGEYIEAAYLDKEGVRQLINELFRYLYS